MISVIFVVGAGTAYAGIVLPTITLAGNVQVDGDLNVDGKLTGDASIIPFKLTPISSGDSIRAGITATCITPQTPCLIIIPHSGKLSDLTVRGLTDSGIAQGPGVGYTYTMTINKNGGLTSLNCIMSGIICKSTTSIEVNQFDRILLNIVASSGANSGNIAASVLYTT